MNGINFTKIHELRLIVINCHGSCYIKELITATTIIIICMCPVITYNTSAFIFTILKWLISVQF